MAMLQLDPPLPMTTPKGEGYAHVLIDYGPESDLYWTVLITATGEIWTYANRHVRAVKNITLGRTCPLLPEDLQNQTACGPGHAEPDMQSPLEDQQHNAVTANICPRNDARKAV